MNEADVAERHELGAPSQPAHDRSQHTEDLKTRNSFLFFFVFLFLSFISFANAQLPFPDIVGVEEDELGANKA